MVADVNFLYHVTLNTGHIRKIYPEEIDKRIYFALRRILRDSLRPEGAEVMEGDTDSKQPDLAIAFRSWQRDAAKLETQNFGDLYTTRPADRLLLTGINHRPVHISLTASRSEPSFILIHSDELVFGDELGTNDDGVLNGTFPPAIAGLRPPRT